MSNQKHLEIPFAGKVELEIKTGKKSSRLVAEAATSEIEIFQAASYRTKKQLSTPLVLLFDDPTEQQFTKQETSFPVEQILVEYGTNKIIGIFPVNPKQSKGKFVQCFSGLSALIIAPLGFASKNNIKLHETKIIVKKRL